MTTPSPTSSGPAGPTPIRFSRTVGPARAIAIGSSITVGLGVFVLSGLLLPQTGVRTGNAYLLSMVLFLPLVLIYAERAEVTPGGGGVFSLVRASGSTWRTYASGWLLLGGHLALISLLGWGAALHLNISLENLLDVTIDMRWLAPIVVIAVALNDLIGTRGGWRLRMVIVYSGVALLLVMAARAWLLPAAEVPGPLHDGSRGLFHSVALLAASLWGINFVLDRRDELRQPERHILPALTIPLVAGGLLGAIAAVSASHALGDVSGDPTPLATLAVYTSFTGEAIFEVIYVTIGLFICLIALDRAMVVMLRLSGTMVRDGFLPERFLKIAPDLGTPLLALRIFAAASALVAAFMPKPLLVGFVALMFLFVTLLLVVPDILRWQPRLPAKRRLKLPLHPLFPIAAAGVSIFLAASLNPMVYVPGVGWVLLGVFFYVGYAQRGGITVRRRETVVGAASPQLRKTTYTVLVSTANPDTAPGLIRTAALLAQAHKGRVLVLKVVTFPDQVPQHIQREEAEKEYQQLQETIACVSLGDIPHKTLVRLAQSPVDGILATVQEERADLMVLGWEVEHTEDGIDLEAMMGPIVSAATCDVVLVRGYLPDTVQRVLVPTAGSPNSIAAIRLAQHLVNNHEGQVVALHMVQEVFHPGTMDEYHQRLTAIIDSLHDTTPIEPLVLATDDVREGILHEAQNFDALLLGASRGGVLDQTIFGGLPVDVVQASPGPALLVKHFEGTRRFWMRRAWEMVSSPIPKPTASERDDIYQQMRRASHPSIDFFILIGLAGMIATLGLLQSNPAIIIGAMLVAPLMSPILAIAMSVVKGDVRLLRMSAEATILGVITAVGVSMLITTITPSQINTTEILVRARPNLLDLLVALASGAAGGYAMGRKEVAAALPGIAIAAALVPPLGVVGYGTATGQLDISGGALLLFITNLVAIVFAASIVFLLLGFRPSQARMRLIVQLKFLLSLLALLLVSIPLAVLSVSGVGQAARQNQIENVFRAELDSQQAQVSEILVERQGEDFIVHATIYALDPTTFTETRIISLQEALSSATGTSVSLRATVLRAVLLPDHNTVLRPTPSPLP